MLFYHGTTFDNWTKIQQEGLLWGIIDDCGGKYHPSRCTYLTPDLEEAKCYGDVILEVEYNPMQHPKKNNWIEDCWQFRVYEPIKLENIKLYECHE